MSFSLILGSALHGDVIHPDVGNMKLHKDPVGSGFPGDAQQGGLIVEGFLAVGRPDLFRDEILNIQSFSTAPESGGGIEGQCFRMGLATAGSRFASGGDGSGVGFHLHFFKFPNQSLSAAMAGFVLE